MNRIGCRAHTSAKQLLFDPIPSVIYSHKLVDVYPLPIDVIAEKPIFLYAIVTII